MTFEDPSQFQRCIQSDCEGYRVSNSPFCARHLADQVKNSATGYVEPELEAKVAKIRTEDDEHPGMIKVYDKETGAPSWVPEPPKLTYVGHDPDTNGIVPPKDAFGVEYVPAPVDPTKVQAKLFRKALRGKLGPLAQALAERTINTIGDIAE